MNHTAIISSEFVKFARKWKDLTYEEQKGYLKRHPRTKRRLTARPDSGRKTNDRTEDANVAETTKQTYADFAAKLSDRSKSDIKAEIDTLQQKMDVRTEAARRREVRAQGNLDGTALERAYERNQPLEIRQKLLKHYLEHGAKKPPQELQEEFESMQEDVAERKKYKLEKKEKLSKYQDKIGKIIHWISKKHFGKEYSGRVISIRAGKWGGEPVYKTDTGWRVPHALVKKFETPSKSEATKEMVSPKDLVGKTITWKTKKRPGTVRRRFRTEYGVGVMTHERVIPGYDPENGTASDKVVKAKRNKVVTRSGWRIPLSLIQEVNKKKFDMWK
jgi:hypothetical protein